MAMDWRYNDRTIEISPEGHFFLDNDDRYFGTLDAAKIAVDDDAKLAAKERHANLSLPVQDADGNRGVLTGINRNTGKPTGFQAPSYFIRSEAIKSLLAERKAINERAAQISLVLKTVTISTISWSRRISVEDYDRNVESLVANFEAALEAASEF